MIPFDENGFREAEATVLAPWLRDHVTGGKISGFDGTEIQYYRAEHPDAKAVIVMVHGYCEFFGKYHETAYDFWSSGYTVYFIELRGHGGSGRISEDPDVVDVRDFSEYVEDLKCLLDQAVLPERQNLILYAHSMGGCVGALFLERYPEYFRAAVLTSPMLKMTFGSLPSWRVNLLMHLSKVLGWNEKLLPGSRAFDPDSPYFEESGTTSQERFQYQFQIRKDPSNGGIYTMNEGTWRWARAAIRATKKAQKYAGRIRVPVLICQSGRDVYVDNDGQDAFAGKLKYAKLVRFPNAEHEIYASDPETMERYYSQLLRMFRKAAEL